MSKEDKATRLAAALRENLKKRKAGATKPSSTDGAGNREEKDQASST